MHKETQKKYIRAILERVENTSQRIVKLLKPLPICRK